MARVHTKKARKQYTCSLTGKTINVGDTYYSFTPYKSFTRKCSRRPRPSEMTSSDKLSRLYSVQEQMEDWGMSEGETIDDLQGVLEGWAEEVREVGQEYEESADNMPENLQSSYGCEELREKASNCEDWAQEIEGIADDFENVDEDDIRASNKDDLDEGEITEEDVQNEIDEAWETLRTEVTDKVNEIAGNLSL